MQRKNKTKKNDLHLTIKSDNFHGTRKCVTIFKDGQLKEMI